MDQPAPHLHRRLEPHRLQRRHHLARRPRGRRPRDPTADAAPRPPGPRRMTEAGSKPPRTPPIARRPPLRSAAPPLPRRRRAAARRHRPRSPRHGEAVDSVDPPTGAGRANLATRRLPRPPRAPLDRWCQWRRRRWPHARAVSGQRPTQRRVRACSSRSTWGRPPPSCRPPFIRRCRGAERMLRPAITAQ